MSLFPRKQRPLKREEGALRDDRLYIVACDDTFAPQQYFGFFSFTRVHVIVIPTTDGSSAARHVLNRLIEYRGQIQTQENDEYWLLLDADHFISESHRQTFLTAINDARQQGFHISISKPCFELWLLLHRLPEENVRFLQDGTETSALLRTTLGRYSKNALNGKNYPLSAVREAIIRAKRLDAGSGGGDIPSSNTTQVYRLWQSIIATIPASQLPEELLGLDA